MYKIIKCQYCKNYVMTAAVSTYKCIHCNKSQDITKMRVYFENENPNLVTKALQRIKQEEFKMMRGDSELDEFM